MNTKHKDLLNNRQENRRKKCVCNCFPVGKFVYYVIRTD